MRVFLVSFFILILNFSFSQLWFDIGAKGGVGTGFLINKTLSNDNRLSVSPGKNHFYGGKFGINFGTESSIILEFSYSNYSYSFVQSGIFDITKTYAYTINYSTLNFAPLYKHTNEAQYIEIGPEFSFFKKGTITDEAQPTTNTPAENAINPLLTGAVFGLGGHIIGGDNLTLSMGLRFRYTFTNLVSSDYSSTNYPFVNYPDITTSTKTNPLSVQLVFELNYSLAQLARATCGKRTALIRM